MARKICSFLMCLIMLVIAVSCNSGNDQDDKSDYPVEVYQTELASCPQNVISLSPSVTDIIYTLGSDAQLIGVSDTCTNEKGLPVYGSSSFPDINGIEEAGCDLVFASGAMREGDVKQLESEGIPVIIVPLCGSYDELGDVYKNIAQAVSGKYTGGKNAEYTFNRIDKRLNEISDKKSDVSVCLVLDDGVCAAKDTFADDMLGFAGGKNTLENFEGLISGYSEVAAADPQIIFCPEELVEKIMSDDKLSKTRAVKSKAVYALSPLYFERMGENIVLGAEIMAAKISDFNK